MASTQSQNWVFSEKVLARSNSRINKIEKSAIERNHSVSFFFKEKTKVITSLEVTCNICGGKWISAPAWSVPTMQAPGNYIRVKNGCYTCAHIGERGLSKLLTKKLYKPGLINYNPPKLASSTNQAPACMVGITIQQLVDSCYPHKKESIELQKYNGAPTMQALIFKIIADF